MAQSSILLQFDLYFIVCRFWGHKLIVCLLIFLLVHGRIDMEAAFRLCVQISQFTTKLNDGCSIDVPQKYDEWTVDCQCYTLDMLEMDLAARINWGSGQ